MSKNTATLVNFAPYITLGAGDAWFAVAGEYFANNLKNSDSLEITELYQHFALSRGISLTEMDLTITYEETADVKETFQSLFREATRFIHYSNQPIFFNINGKYHLPIMMDMRGAGPRDAFEAERTVFKHHQDFAGSVKVVLFRIMLPSIIAAKEGPEILSQRLSNTGIHCEFSTHTVNLL